MSKNDVTGDNIVTKAPSKAYDEGYDRIFKKKLKTEGCQAEHKLKEKNKEDNDK